MGPDDSSSVNHLVNFNEHNAELSLTCKGQQVVATFRAALPNAAS